MSCPRLCLLSAAVLGFACLAVRAGAQLADSSPFLPAGVAGGASADASALELRGILVGPEGTRYDIYDPAKKYGTWAGVNEKGHDFTIRSADPDPTRGRILVQAAGRTYPLQLKSARASAAGLGGPGMQAGNAGAANVTPADEAQRLAAVAEEVRRRRQLRDQAAQGGGQPPANAAQAGDEGQGRGRRRQGQ
ncbi:MAG TPA: hypothetical protein VHV47_04960 [Opitutaceae bacterium]|jgi:hypothetical protein|nr:hypothetical protein [Opitutaceae bacterium]